MIEACLELLDTKLVVGIQDLGGAGLACATSETAGRGGVGMDVDVSAVPRREEGMEPWEVMTSESQERMLAIVTPESWPAVAAICAKWEVRATVVGTVMEPEPGGGGRLRIRDGMDGPVLADVPAASLSDDAPLYDRPRRAPARAVSDPPAPPTDCAADLLALLRSPGWVYRQYDHQLFLNTVAGPGADAALLRLAGPGLPASDRGVALTTDSNPRACALDPRRGPALVLAEGVANLACVGATPAAVVNCLNFGNPEHPEVMWQLSECIDGMAEACRRARPPRHRRQRQLLQRERRVRHRPDAGARRARPRRRPPRAAARAGLVRRRHASCCSGRATAADGSFPLEGTRWATERRDHRTGQVPSVDFAAHAAVCAFVAGPGRRAGGRAATAAPLVHAVHDVSGGGLAVTLAEMAAAAGTGCTLDLERGGRALHRAAVALRRGDGRSRRAVPPGRGGRDPGRRAGSGGRRPVHPGRLVDLPLDALRQAHEGNLALALGEP